MSEIFGVSLVSVGPGVSAATAWFPSMLIAGSSATVNIRIPIPPIQWVNERHKSMLFGRISTSGTAVAPVVVNPDTASKNALAGFGIAPVKIYGRQPKIQQRVQDTTTINEPSLIFKRGESGVIRPNINPPVEKVNRHITPKIFAQRASLYISAVINGSTITPPNIARIAPTTLQEALILIFISLSLKSFLYVLVNAAISAIAVRSEQIRTLSPSRITVFPFGIITLLPLWIAPIRTPFGS